MVEEEYARLLDAASRRRHRGVAIVDRPALNVILGSGKLLGEGVYIGPHRPAGLEFPANTLELTFSPHSFRKLLGSTVDFVVYDARMRYSSDALAASADAVRGGGVFVFLVDPGNPPRHVSLGPGSVRGVVVGRFIAAATRRALHIRFTSTFSASNILPDPVAPPAFSREFWSSDQKQAFNKISEWLGEPGCPVFILHSRRGRGKSACLGYVVAQLLEDGVNTWVTAPDPSNASAVFQHVTRRLEHHGRRYELTRGSRLRITCGGASASYTHMDEAPDHAFVVVDEASGFSVNRLCSLVNRSRKVVLAATTYGYEGSGRSFPLRLASALRESGLSTRNIQLYEPTQPIRYAEGDPLEEALSDTFLFDCQPPRVSGGSNPVFAAVSPSELASGDEHLLRGVYSVLSHAHYRNQPDDLSLLLEDGNSSVYTLLSGGDPVAVCRVKFEEPMGEARADAVLRGASFPGGLVSERLSVRAQNTGLASMRGATVSRIAVDPRLQHRGLGSSLLEQVQSQLASHVDWLGCSFSLNPKVASFWRRNGFFLLALSVNRDTYLGSLSAICFKPLSERSRAWLHSHWYRLYELMLAEIESRGVDPESAAQILKSLSPLCTPEREWLKVLERVSEWSLLPRFAYQELRKTLPALSSKLTAAELSAIIQLLTGEATGARLDRARRVLRTSLNTLY